MGFAPITDVGEQLGYKAAQRAVDMAQGTPFRDTVTKTDRKATEEDFHQLYAQVARDAKAQKVFDAILFNMANFGKAYYSSARNEVPVDQKSQQLVFGTYNGWKKQTIAKVNDLQQIQKIQHQAQMAGLQHLSQMTENTQKTIASCFQMFSGAFAALIHPLIHGSEATGQAMAHPSARVSH